MNELTIKYDMFDLVTVNGRISKKLCEKVFIKQIESKDKEIALNTVKIQELEEEYKAEIKILREALEESCVDDCAITLSVCHRNTLEGIIRATDERARQALAEIDKMKGV